MPSGIILKDTDDADIVTPDADKKVLFFDDITGLLSYKDDTGTVFTVVGSGSSGITSLTGDVTATGPGAAAATLAANLKLAAITFIISGGGVAITTGLKYGVYVPYACTIQEVTMGADVSGSIVVDIWKDSYANFPPTVADTITASAKPTISSATKSQDSTLTGWTTSIAAGSWLYFNVDSVTSITYLMLTLKVSKT